ncbi:aminoglycoside phosphotransferase family protein [Dactylosporangium sp. NBC_01737]|uniref:aminoglycoside phosphotransferase family protein n=1 Tax=Dactylosporangium sp. NBC_01737 TaxID=2975959 RepID=UPI002E116961|nr:aminoglycoside phosphotransferase family protein [Dactylosporangium sp. NBC_01737]
MIDADLVRALVREQFPAWAALAVTPVPRQGWDNRTFRLGDELSVRLPSAEGYVAAVQKEDRWLPALAGRLPLPIPEPVAVGAPAGVYPFPWSVRRWLPGDVLAASDATIALAEDLGGFLTALRSVPAQGGPVGGRHCFYRGCHPSVYGDGVQEALRTLGDTVDTAACERVWAQALTSAWQGPPVWFHGDVAAGNLLTTGGRLSAVIDFGTCGVGDPACDLVIAWTHFHGPSRRAFRVAAGLPDAAWRRARGWALWKALVTLAGASSPDQAGVQARTLQEVLRDPVV